MGEIADLKAANTQLQRIVAQLKASLADVASLNDTVADLRQQVSDAHKRVAALEYTDMRSLVSSAERAEHQFHRLRRQADEMNVVDCPPQDLNC
jgi:chromosome segregation ATPase